MYYFRKFNRFILISLALLGVSVTSANAALVTELLGLDVDGTSYDVRIHTGFNDTFNALWDGDDDDLFGADGSLFDSAPTFWGDSVGALAAAEAIIGALGSLDTTKFGIITDSFRVPYGFAGTSGSFVHVFLDDATSPFLDVVDDALALAGGLPGEKPYASFIEVSAVPVPAAIWLFGTALIGLVGFSKRKSRIAA